MSAADLARIYPARRVMDPGTEPMSRKGYTGHPVASPHATEVPDQGEGLTDAAAHLAHLNPIAGRCLRGRGRRVGSQRGPPDERSRERTRRRHRVDTA